MKSLISMVLPFIVESLLKILTPEQLEKVADKILDWCEDAVAKTENEYDNAIVLPLIGIIREAFGIEDGAS